MPRRSGAYGVPKDWVVAGEWPDGTFAEDTPTSVGHAVAIAIALGAALQGRNKSEVAAAAGIERSTLYDILAGRSWAELVTLANLESALQVTLWPDSPAPEIQKQ